MENPWHRAVQPLVLTLQALVFAGLATLADAEPMRTGYTLCALGAAAMAVYLSSWRAFHLERARAALELNPEPTQET